ncbi:hypothetical protein SMC26_39935 [Actinomadura fulvescens]
MTDQTVRAWNILGEDLAPSQAAPAPDQRWDFDGGFALVYLANSRFGLAKPVIFADGFNSGPSNPDAMWEHLERREYAMATALRERGSDLIMLGYTERSAAIQDNANVAIACISRAIADRRGNEPLVAGGFSMGGLVTRYALAKMEQRRQDHQTAVYFSWDSPHRGAWIPISLQAMAHYLKDQDGVTEMSDYINSPAARELLRWHIDTVTADTDPDPLRAVFLEELERYGSWPQRPLKLGLANGSGQGNGLQINAGAEMLKATGLLHPYRTTTLYAQARGDDKLVAHLKRQRITNPPPAVERHTSGLPEADAAPGGTLRSFGIARDNLAALGAVECPHEWVSFVPTVSAVAIRDIDQQQDLYANVATLPPDESDLDEFKCASDNQEHSLVTPELADWLLARLPK